MSKETKCFTIGTDPEFMLKRGDKLISAIPVIKGTKDKPILLDNGAHLSYDNVAVEFATKKAGSITDFVKKVRTSFQELQKILPKGCTVHAVPSDLYPSAELNTEEAQEFGCDPDFNAWNCKVNERPDTTKNPRLRSFGGHIHVGQVKGYPFLKHPRGKVLLVQVMDAVLGIISVTLDTSMEARNRRELYGKAGSHRPTTYGVEYRTLSNFWLKDPKLVRLMYLLVQDCLTIVDSNKAFELINEIGADRIQETINESWAFDAKKIIADNLQAYLSKKSKIYLRRVNKELKNIKKDTLEYNWNIPTVQVAIEGAHVA